MFTAPKSLCQFRLAGKAAELTLIHGSVLSNQRWSQSETSWAPWTPLTGAAVDQVTGKVYLPEIRTHVTQNQEFWLRLETGDMQYRYAGRTIPVTTGQEVTVISMKVGNNAGTALALVNHSARTWHPMIDLGVAVHTYFFRRPSWIGTFARALFGWAVLIAIGIFCATAGAPALKALVTSAPAQSVLGTLVRILPSPPGAHDRGETMVAVVAIVGLTLIILPPVLALWRHGRRYAYFNHLVESLTVRLDQLASTFRKGKQ